jgi:hypothetical protein
MLNTVPLTTQVCSFGSKRCANAVNFDMEVLTCKWSTCQVLCVCSDLFYRFTFSSQQMTWACTRNTRPNMWHKRTCYARMRKTCTYVNGWVYCLQFEIYILMYLKDCTHTCRLRHGLVRHLQTHTNDKQYACINCGATFVQANKYIDHITRSHTVDC